MASLKHEHSSSVPPSRKRKRQSESEELFCSNSSSESEEEVSIIQDKTRRGRELEQSTALGQSNQKWNYNPPPVVRASLSHSIPARVLVDWLTCLRVRELGVNWHPSFQWRNPERLLKESFVQYQHHYAWTGASDKVMSTAWSPDGSQYAVGAATKLDDANLQHNRGNNLLFGNFEKNTLQELSSHFVERSPPSPASGDTSSRYMQRVVDSMLHLTVSSVCFNSDGSQMMSGAYDKKLRVWDVSEKQQPRCVIVADHLARIDHLSVSYQPNIVASAQHDVKAAIHLHNTSTGEHERQLFLTHFSSSRASKHHFYYPTCLEFGPVATTRDLLLAGFAEESEPKRDSKGDLCLWDVETSKQMKLTPFAQFVFNVSWHPSLPLLAAATVPGDKTILTYRHVTKTVIRTWNPRHRPSRIMEYECPGSKVNTVKFHPFDSKYIAAGCTDGISYVWDMRMPDDILHRLQHGPPIDEHISRGDQDTGVRFSAWSQDGRLFYSGSSDGELISWDIFRAPEDVNRGTVAHFKSRIMSGAFSPDNSNLLIGTSGGEISVLSSSLLSSQHKGIERPQSFRVRSTGRHTHENALDGIVQLEGIQHIPAPPPAHTESSGVTIANELVKSGHILVHPDLGAGKGPCYDGPYSAQAHPTGQHPSTTDLLPDERVCQLDRKERKLGKAAGGRIYHNSQRRTYRNAEALALARNVDVLEELKEANAAANRVAATAPATRCDAVAEERAKAEIKQLAEEDFILDFILKEE